MLHIIPIPVWIPVTFRGKMKRRKNTFLTIVAAFSAIVDAVK